MQTPPKMDLQLSYQQVKNHIRELASGDTQAVELLAVSKGQTAPKLRQLFACGQLKFGENYVQELLTKSEQLQDLPIQWIFIGHLQSNKIRKIVGVAQEIQSVGNLRQAQQIASCAKNLGKTPYPIWIEVNAAAEAGKHGCLLSELADLTFALKALPDLRLMGIMSIPPAEFQDSTQDEVPKLYHQLRQLADNVGEAGLSLGMSGDLQLAIKAGSSQVRIGTGLFGPRQV